MYWINWKICHKAKKKKEKKRKEKSLVLTGQLHHRHDDLLEYDPNL